MQKGVVAGTPKVSQDSVRLLRLGSWNLAGIAEGDAMTILAEQVGMDVVAVQEWPKAKPGWKLMLHAGYNAVIFQDIMTYRGVGVVYRDSSLRLLKKKSTARGSWFLFRCKQTGKDVWVGSAHLQGSECNAEYETRVISRVPGGAAQQQCSVSLPR